MTTFIQKAADVRRTWHLVDAADKPLGTLAVRVAVMLRGKNRPTFTPHVDGGDFVIVINAAKVRLTGSKEDKKIYTRFSGYRHGLREMKASFVRERHPDRMIQQAVRGMLPDNTLCRKMLKRLKVYAGAEHPHAAQSPTPAEV